MRRNLSTRVLVVDDTALFRQIVSGALAGIPGVEVVGSAADGRRALARLEALQPDVMTLDMEMPTMDGLEVIETVRGSGSKIAIIIVSSHSDRDSAARTRAMELGVLDIVRKPDAGTPERTLLELRKLLIPVLKAHERSKGLRQGKLPDFVRHANGLASASPAPVITPSLFASIQGPPIVLIGASTGGPAALAELLPALPEQFQAPVLIVQHMPPLFTQALARNLQPKCAIRVREAADQEIALPGCAYIAPGGQHMKVASGPSGSLLIKLTNDPPENNCRPSVDYLFRSVALRFPGRSVAAILTGMGNDGARGLAMLKRGGCYSIAQDESTSVVFGMPREAILTGAVDHVIPLPKIAANIVRAVNEATA